MMNGFENVEEEDAAGAVCGREWNRRTHGNIDLIENRRNAANFGIG